MRAVSSRSSPRRDAHVKRGAHVEPHGQPMQLGHHRVLETDALELFAACEHLRTDEARDVVDDHPGRRPEDSATCWRMYRATP